MHNLHHKLYVIEGFNGMLYVFSSHCYCHPVIYSLSLFIIYSVNSFIANVICYITIPSLNKVLYLVYLVSCRILVAKICFSFRKRIINSDNSLVNELMVLSILPHRYLVKCEHGGVAFLTHIHSNRCIIAPMVMCVCQPEQPLKAKLQGTRKGPQTIQQQQQCVPTCQVCCIFTILLLWTTSLSLNIILIKQSYIIQDNQ